MSSGPMILASHSPRRAEILRAHGFHFRVVPAPDPEPDILPDSQSPAEYVEATSLFKAKSVARIEKSGLILAADTVAALAGRVFGKPRDRADAGRILTSIAGTTHQVLTAVTLVDASSGRADTRHDVTQVVMRELSGKEIDEYLDSGAWQGKAGAYGIQDAGDAFVDRIEGSFTNVVGLPIELLRRMLTEWDEMT